MSTSKRDLLSPILDASTFVIRRPPQRGEVVPIARWRDPEVGLGAVLFLRHRNDGRLASELSVAIRDCTGGWASLGMDSGAGDYPNIFSTQLSHSEKIANMGLSETWLSDPDLNDGKGAPLRLFEIAVGESIAKITCSVNGRVVEQEISPLRIALIGAWSEHPATFHAYTREGDRRDIPAITSSFE